MKCELQWMSGVHPVPPHGMAYCQTLLLRTLSGDVDIPFGKPVLLLVLVAVVTGAVLLCGGLAGQSSQSAADLHVWVFDESHAASYRGAPAGEAEGTSLVDQFAAASGKNVQVDVIQSRVLDARLLSLFMADRHGAELPDLVEIEIGSVGKYFRHAADRVPFLPLNDLLRQSGLDHQIVPTRFAPWTRDGVIFGVPWDVHPVVLIYRRDLFDVAGVDLSAAKTWPEFHALCLQFQNYWRNHDQPNRRALEFSRSGASQLMMLLLQRGINLVDDRGELHLDDPRLADTIGFCAGLSAGADRIADDSSAGTSLWVRDLADGRICAMLCPDWRLSFLRESAADQTRLSGKLAMISLPRFDPSDAPTSTWGGTMLAIPRHARDPQLSWKLLQYLLVSPQGLAAREQHTDILPPLPAAWNGTSYDAADPLFAGQHTRRLLADLAAKVPANNMHPYTPMAAQSLAGVYQKAVAHVDIHGTKGLPELCRQWLVGAQSDLARYIAFGQGEPRGQGGQDAGNQGGRR